MTPPVYYNEIEPSAAAWLRELCREGLIPAGEIDTRSIEDIRPNDLKPFRQCHFFAGIGGWAYALRLAGWPDDLEVWTGSCPCQPYSTAGKGAGAADERHLWPAWHHLIDERRPRSIFGEQVASKGALGWWDLVHADLALSQYACWAADLCAAGVGAPHIRQRLYFVADAERADIRGGGLGSSPAAQNGVQRANGQRQWLRADVGAGGSTVAYRLAHGGGPGLEVVGFEQAWGQRSATERGGSSHWSDVEWLPCRDGKARPTQPGLQPLAHGVPARVGRLRGYGNAIVPQVAVEMISAYMDHAGILEQLG